MDCMEENTKVIIRIKQKTKNSQEIFFNVVNKCYLLETFSSFNEKFSMAIVSRTGFPLTH